MQTSGGFTGDFSNYDCAGTVSRGYGVVPDSTDELTIALMAKATGAPVYRVSELLGRTEKPSTAVGSSEGL